MSGIVGLHRRGPIVTDVELEHLTATLAPRGPDGGGTWSDGVVGLGHRLLATTPEAVHEKLPLFDTTGDRVLTADARLDNRDELIPGLGLAGRPPSELTDAELILHAYARWGERCPERLLGDFAFAVWDRRQQTLFCARDQLGVRPFYYYAGPRAFVFGSTLRAVLASPDVPRRLCEARIAAYLANVRDDVASTFHRDVFRLPPGHCLTVSGSVVGLRPYWTLDPGHEGPPVSESAAAEAFRDLFVDAVRRRLRRAGRAGATLSGGLDSASIACVARDLGAREPAGFPTFSATFPTIPACDERAFVEAVVAQGGLEAHVLQGDRLNPLAELAARLADGNDSLHDPDYYMHWALFDAARDAGVRVLLGGHGGDTTVSHGVAYLAELLRRGRVLALSRELAGLARTFGRPAGRLALHALWPAAPHPARAAWRRLRASRRAPAALVHPELARRVGLAARVDAFIDRWHELARSSRTHHWGQITAAAGLHALEAFDWAAGARGVEPRHPFLDRRLVELCLALPAAQKLSRGVTRAVQHRAMAGIVPAPIAARPGKADLGRMLPAALAAFGRAPLDDLILGDTKVLAPYVDLPRLRERYRRYTQGSRSDAPAVWRVATLALWLRAWSRGELHRFAAGPPARASAWAPPFTRTQETP